MADAEKILFYMSMALFWGSMIVACIMDWRERMVYRIVWLIGGLAAGVLIALRAYGDGIQLGAFVDLVVYVFIQQFGFARLYGRADCHAFCVCAALMLSLGLGFKAWLMHMLFAFAGLALVQLVRRNVGKDGNLKRPVALIPYITTALGLYIGGELLLVDFTGGKW